MSTDGRMVSALDFYSKESSQTERHIKNVHRIVRGRRQRHRQRQTATASSEADGNGRRS
ncbi:hypothetical protein DPMN_164372 [Dreissena polymorpha]|uniref:Uncharacterized protein n=1 Tax=Dreissena polymorpha TaxID=45954 RepID=A0A9D4EXQ5_DREPO|nr:hypothetical protein DPMN_164372 [Dreissena polymorpha]